mmetsp:Transcript_85182/g.245908  ORF Transcript_85182/g.245908 Transcript_85182/m.245908 type:complete len:257 (-) Transcript_85182:66-836(-)
MRGLRPQGHDPRTWIFVARGPTRSAMAADHSGPPGSKLNEILAELGPFTLKPRCFMVAWSGVLVLAFEGWPSEVERVKRRISDEGLPVPPENPGSIWPKTSLAAMHDNKRLTPEQLEALSLACVEATDRLKASSWEVQVDTLHSTTYLCRSHERLMCSAALPLRGPLAGPPSEGSQRYVNEVVGQCGSEGYWFHASRDGSRAGHYRGNVIGNSMVAWLASPPPGLDTLREQVEAALPGYYCWFADSSFHCTLRALS